jgi:HEAT repeat protein
MSGLQTLQAALTAADFRESQTLTARLAALPADALAPVLLELARALGEHDARTQRRAALLHALLGPLASANVSALLAAVVSPAWPVREAVVQALGRVAPDQAAVQTALVERALFDRSEAVRLAAREALVGHAEQGVLSTLRSALAHDHAWVRCRALLAMAALTDPHEQVEILARALEDSHFRVRRTAADLLAGTARAGLAALPRLARYAFDGEWRVALMARHALDRLGRELHASAKPQAAERQEVLGALVSTVLAADRAREALIGMVPALPSALRDEFGALCRRRQLWHCANRQREAPEAVGSLLERLDATLAATGRPDGEAGWLLAWVWSALLDYYQLTSR